MRIGIAGKQGSGKTTLADEFVRLYDFKKLSFANAVKDVAMSEYGLTYDEAYGSKKKRTVLQTIGADKRKQNKDFWVNQVIEQIREDPDKDYVIDDVRYKNEFDALKKEGFIMVRIEATEEKRKDRILPRFANPEHQSEIDLDDVSSPFNLEADRTWDVQINNENVDLFRFLGATNSIYKAFSEKDNV